jgi:hypothetical protein
MIWTSLALASVGSQPVPVGTSIDSAHTTSLELDLDIRLAGRDFQRRIDREHTQRTTVVPRANGFDVHWSDNRHQVKEPGYAHDRILPVVGHRYRVMGGVVSRLDGVLTDEMRDIVQQIHVVEQIDTLRAMLPSALGETAPAGSMFAGMLADAPGEARVVGGTLTWTGEADGLATFDVALHLAAAGTDERGAWVETEVHGRGTLVVEVETGWTRTLDVQGDVRVTAHRSDLRTTGTGRFRSVTVLEYGR